MHKSYTLGRQHILPHWMRVFNSRSGCNLARDRHASCASLRSSQLSQSNNLGNARLCCVLAADWQPPGPGTTNSSCRLDLLGGWPGKPGRRAKFAPKRSGCGNPNESYRAQHMQAMQRGGPEWNFGARLSRPATISPATKDGVSTAAWSFSNTGCELLIRRCVN